MPAEEVFLQAIREHPEDNLPRLVFADWLDEQGQSPRAEFVRVQCELSILADTDPRLGALKVHADELEAAHRQGWVGPLHDHPSCSVTFRRGFVDRVNFSDYRQGPAVLSALRVAFARNAISELDYYCSSDGLPDNRVSELLRESLNWPEFRSLRHLKLSYYRSLGPDGWEDDEVEQLIRNPHLSNLTSLSLRSDVSPGQLARLGQATFASSLRRFHANMGPDGDHQDWCRVWRQLPFLHQLTELDLGIDWHTDDTLAALLEADLPNVRSVNLNCNDLTEGVFSVLAGWPRLGQVHSLELMSNNLGPSLFTRLAELPAGTLRVLSLGGEIYRNRATRVFLSRPGSFDPGSFVGFVNSPLAGRLTELMVTEVTSGGLLVRALSDAPLHALTKLNLYQVEFERDDLQHLLSAEWFGHLRHLRIGRHGSTDADAELFLSCPLHPEATLSLDFGYSNSQVSPDMKKKLRERWRSQIQISPE